MLSWERVIYIRNKSEALDAVAAVLALPERRQQIVQITVRVAMCLETEARNFLADCQAGLIENGLEYMRQRRRDLMAAQQKDAPEAIIIVDGAPDPLLEQVGSALDALRLAGIALQVFPALRERFAPWEAARAFLAAESEVRPVMIKAVQAHGAGNRALYDQCRDEMIHRVAAARPAWSGVLPTLKAACDEAAPGDANLLSVVAVDDERADLAIDLLAQNRAEALDYLGNLKTHIDLLHELELQQG